MLFSLKKIISAFLMPIPLGLIALLIGIYFLYKKSFKKAKIFLILSFSWLFLISYAPFANFMIKPLESQYKAYVNVDKTINYVLVLGSGHTTNSEISSNSQLSNSALMRLIEGIRIYRNLDNAKLIVSGYGGNDITPHAFISKDVALSLGVPLKDIITQESAKDTFEEASYAKKIVQNERFILVTSASHMPRAMKIFESQWLNPIAAPTDFLYRKEGEYISRLSANELRKTQYAMHEYIGTIWHTIIEKIRFYLN